MIHGKAVVPMCIMRKESTPMVSFGRNSHCTSSRGIAVRADPEKVNLESIESLLTRSRRPEKLR